MTKSVMPWSLKGVSPEAREIAKKAAAQHGMTIGEWVSRAIRDVGPEAGLPAAAPLAETAPSDPLPADPADEVALRKSIRERIYASEEQIAHIVGPLQDIIEEMSRRLVRLEEDAADGLVEDAAPEERRQLDRW